MPFSAPRVALPAILLIAIGTITCTVLANRADTVVRPPEGAASWEDAPTTHLLSGPYAGCELKRYDDVGWLVGRCGELHFLIQAGFAGRRGPVSLRAIISDRIGAFVHERRVTIAGRSVPGNDIINRQAREVPMMFGPSVEQDPQGRILDRGLHVRITTPESGSVGATCHADVGAWDESACIQLLEKFMRHGLPGGPITSRSLVVAGIPLDFTRDQCWSSEPGSVYCLHDGGMRWAHGTRTRMGELQATAMRNAAYAPRPGARQEAAEALNANRDQIHMLAMVAELERTGEITSTEPPTFSAEDFPEMRLTQHEQRCRIGGAEGTCTRIDYYAALDHVVEYAYYARLPSDDGETLVHCRHAYDQAAPSPCRQVFGPLIVPPVR